MKTATSLPKSCWVWSLRALLMLPLISAAVEPNALRAADGEVRSSPHATSPSRSQAYLGVEVHDITDDQLAALHIKGGRAAEITMVDHDGPAGKAGLQPHDIVVQVDGQSVDGAEDLRRRIREWSPGKTVTFAIMRLGRAMTLTAKIVDREELERNAWQPSPTPSQGTETQNVLVERYADTPPAPKSSHGQSFLGSVLRSGPYTGVSLDSMKPQLAGFFGASAKNGLLIDEIDANSPAAVAGLHAGDVVLRVDGNTVGTPSEWTKRVRAANGRAVTLTILRERHEQTVVMQPDLKRHSLLEWPKLF